MKKETAVYKRTIFPNGLKVITEAIPHVRSITLGLWIDCGSRDEEEASSGLSHFIEHMVFKGTKNRTASEIASYIESVGGVINAFTSREETCFYAKFLDEHLPLSVELIFDLINNPLFDPAEIEKEKHVVLEEIKDVDDNPSDLVHEMFAKILFNKHPLGRSILGTRRSVRNLTRTKILSHRERYYRPEKMLVAASGNLKHDQVVELVGRYINPWSFEPSSSGREKPLFKPIRKIYDRKISQTHVCLGVPAKEFNHPSRTPLMLLNLLLGGGMSSRLFQQLRERRASDHGFPGNHNRRHATHARTTRRPAHKSRDRGSSRQPLRQSWRAVPDCDSRCKSPFAQYAHAAYRVPKLLYSSSIQT